MAEPTEDEVRAWLESERRIAERGAAVAREVSMSDRAYERLRVLASSALALLDEARKDREELAVWRLAGEQCVEIQRDYADNGEPVGYIAQLAPEGFAALSDWHLGETPFGAVRAAIDQARTS